MPVPPGTPASTTPAKTTVPAVSQVSQAPAQAADPVCGMDVEVKVAVAAGRKSDVAGRTYYFCSDDCKKQFDKEPGKYAAK